MKKRIMCFIVTFALCIGFIVPVQLASASTDITDDFTCPVFRERIVQQHGTGGRILSTDVNGVTDLRVLGSRWSGHVSSL